MALPVAFISFGKKIGGNMPRSIGWLVTFLYINITWIFFRALSFDEAVKMLKGIFGLNGIEVMKRLPIPPIIVGTFGIIKTNNWFKAVNGHSSTVALTIIVALFVVLFIKNSNELKDRWSDSITFMLSIAVLFVIAVCGLNRISSFLYFNF